MTKKQKKQIGIGAVCSVLKRFLHPKPIVGPKYPNTTAKDRLEGLLVIRREEKSINGQSKQCIIFRHGDFENIEIYCVERYAKVTTEGAEADFFGEVEQQTMATVEVETEQNNESEVNLEGNDLAENMARLKLEGYGVDDDNDPAPENIPIL